MKEIRLVEDGPRELPASLPDLFDDSSHDLRTLVTVSRTNKADPARRPCS